MRALALSLSFLLAACGKGEGAANEMAAVAPDAGVDVFAGKGRDRLCLSRDEGGPAGFITFEAAGDANCMVRGTYDKAGGAIVPTGDALCRIPVFNGANGVRLGDASSSCAYYCGQNAVYADRRFERKPGASPATDLAGDPLC